MRVRPKRSRAKLAVPLSTATIHVVLEKAVVATLFTVVLTLILSFTPIGSLFGFGPLSAHFFCLSGAL